MQGDHSKVYPTAEEEKRRFDIFEKNVKTIREHNEKYQAGEVTWEMGINQFADLTSEEVVKYHTGLRKPENVKKTGLSFY